MAPSMTQLLIVLVIVILIFGTRKLRNMGGDLGSAVRNFKKSVKDDSSQEDGEQPKRVIEGESEKQNDNT